MKRNCRKGGVYYWVGEEVLVERQVANFSIAREVGSLMMDQSVYIQKKEGLMDSQKKSESGCRG